MSSATSVEVEGEPEKNVFPSGEIATAEGKHFLFLLRARVSGKPEVGRLMLASTDSAETQLLIDDATNAVYVEPGYLLYGRAGNLNAWRFDAGSRRLVGQPVPVVKEKLSFWEAKNLVVVSASNSGTLV